MPLLPCGNRRVALHWVGSYHIQCLSRLHPLSQGRLNALGIISGVSGKSHPAVCAKSAPAGYKWAVRGSKPLKFSGNSLLTY